MCLGDRPSAQNGHQLPHENLQSLFLLYINQWLFFSKETAVDGKVHKQVHHFSPPLLSSLF